MAHYSEGMRSDFVKQRQAAPEGFFAAEAAGLQWLADPDAVPVVEVVDHGEDFLRLRRLDETGPDAAAAVDFGRRLARLHDVGAFGFGWSPAAPAFFRSEAAPEGFFAAEAAGLQWLADPDAVPVVEVVDHGEDFLRLRRLDETGPDAAAAVDFGRRLARLHDVGAFGFGWSPAAPAFFGPLDAPFEVSTESETSFSEFWTAGRLSPLL